MYWFSTEGSSSIGKDCHSFEGAELSARADARDWGIGGDQVKNVGEKECLV
jgi:hypothetical protein